MYKQSEKSKQLHLKVEQAIDSLSKLTAELVDLEQAERTEQLQELNERLRCFNLKMSVFVDFIDSYRELSTTYRLHDLENKVLLTEIGDSKIDSVKANLEILASLGDLGINPASIRIDFVRYNEMNIELASENEILEIKVKDAVATLKKGLVEHVVTKEVTDLVLAALNHPHRASNLTSLANNSVLSKLGLTVEITNKLEVVLKKDNFELYTTKSPLDQFIVKKTINTLENLAKLEVYWNNNVRGLRVSSAGVVFFKAGSASLEVFGDYVSIEGEFIHPKVLSGLLDLDYIKKVVNSHLCTKEERTKLIEENLKKIEKYSSWSLEEGQGNEFWRNLSSLGVFSLNGFALDEKSFLGRPYKSLSGWVVNFVENDFCIASVSDPDKLENLIENIETLASLANLGYEITSISKFPEDFHIGAFCIRMEDTEITLREKGEGDIIFEDLSIKTFNSHEELKVLLKENLKNT